MALYGICQFLFDLYSSSKLELKIGILTTLLWILKESSFFSYFIMFWLENTLIILVTFSKEMVIKFDHWSLINFWSFQFSMAIVLMTIFIIFEVISNCISIFSLKYLKGFWNDMRINWCTLSLYYFEFYFVWFTLAILISLNSVLDSVILWIIFTSFYAIFTLLGFIKQFHSFKTQILSFLSKNLVIMVCVFEIICHYKNYIGASQNKIFVICFVIFEIVIFLCNFIFSILDLVFYIR